MSDVITVLVPRRVHLLTVMYWVFIGFWLVPGLWCVYGMWLVVKWGTIAIVWIMVAVFWKLPIYLIGLAKS